MGMESFFVIILPPGVTYKKNELGINYYIGKSFVSTKSFNIFIKHEFKIENLLDQYECNLANKILLKIEFKNNFLNSINLESCLYYLHNDNYIKGVLNKFIINEYNIFHPAIGFYNKNLELFLKQLKSFYNKKIIEFLNKYQNYFLNKDILPGKKFYVETNK